MRYVHTSHEILWTSQKDNAELDELRMRSTSVAVSRKPGLRSLDEKEKIQTQGDCELSMSCGVQGLLKRAESAAGGGLLEAGGGQGPSRQVGPRICAGSHPSHRPPGSLQAADPRTRTIADPEQGQGHVDRVVLCTSLFCLNDEATLSMLAVKAKSDPRGQESPRGQSRCI